VLADVRVHEPGDAAVRPHLLDECHVSPAVGAQLAGVVVGAVEIADVVDGDVVPLLAGDLARLAADADRGVGEEADGLARFGRGDEGRWWVWAFHHRAHPSNRLTSQVAAFTSWMWTLGSSTIAKASLAESPWVS